MVSIPKRASMVEQAAASIREAVVSQTWVHSLPSQRHLSDQLQISRPTLRLALAQLAREGLIEIGHGCRTRILLPQKKAAKEKPVDTVAFLVMRKITSPASVLIIRNCQSALQKAGYATEFYEQPYTHSKDQTALLRELIARRKGVIWLLISADPEQQKVFEEMGARAIILGCAYEGIGLPSVDIDYAALASHAWKTFHRLGHRRIHAILFERSLAGDLITEQTLEKMAASPAFAGVAYRYSRSDGTPESICRIMAGLLASRHPPTAIFVMYGRQALTVLTYLMKQHREVPGDFSLICRDDDECLTHVVPAIAAYRSNRFLEIRKVVRSVRLLAESPDGKPGSMFFIPKFEPRMSIGPCRPPGA